MWRFLAAVGVTVAVMVGSAHAAAPAAQGITVVPAIQQITLPGGSMPVRSTVRLTNNTPRPITLALSAQDFTYLNQNGSLRFLEPNSTTTGAHGLAEAIQFDRELVRLSPGQSAAVSLEIVHPNQLAPGGHYAAVVYREVDPAGSAGSITIGLKPAVATLLFVTTAGQGSAGLQLTTPVIDSFATSIPASLDLVFTNAGNTQTAVHGIVQIVAPGGRVVAQGVINVNSGLILPAAERLFSVPLAQLGTRPWWPGPYQLRVQYRHDGQTNYTSYTQTFSYIDGRILVVLVLATLGLTVTVLRRFGPGRRYLLRRKN